MRINAPLLLAALVVLTSCASGKKPVIGISSGWDDARVVSLNDTYVAAVRAAGGVPMVLPPVRSAEEAADALSLVDALILSGGEDVDPARYGEDPLNPTVEVNAPRDTSDFLLASGAMERKMPVLGICRGSQLLNVLLGGSLYQDLPSQIGSTISHRQNESGSVGTHRIYIDTDSRLHRLLGLDSVKVNSFHHQAVKEAGAGVRVVARASDGVVEAWEWSGGAAANTGKGSTARTGVPYILCVQFHPEIFVKAGDTTFLPLFQDLVNRAR